MSHKVQTGAPATSGVPGAAKPLEKRLRALQLGLSADAIRDTALSSPVWAVIMATLFGGVLPDLGMVPFSRSWPWIVACTIVAAAVWLLWRIVKSRAASEDLDGRVWPFLLAGAYFSVAAAWCVLTPLFWVPDSVANHCFLLVLTISAVALFLSSRSGQFEMVVAATLPNIGMVWIHFLQQTLWFDTIIAILLPLWTVQLHLDSWRGCRSVAAAHRTKLEMETLAAELAVARDEAARANKAKSLFLANMSHELRTPLNAILGFSEVILTEALGKDARERYRDYVGDIARSGRHLLGLIDDVLDIAKIEAEKLELDCQWLDGAGVMYDCASIFSERAAKGAIALTTSTSTPDLRLYADERAFRQILINLLSNAIKFTPPGGKIAAELVSVEGGVMLSVRDTGCGIPADQMPRLFQPFEQLDNRYGRANGGTGLGLTLVRALSELHGGNCRIESKVGEGTTAFVYLPNTERRGLNNPVATRAA